MSEETMRFDMDMDGSMEPAENGQWVRYEDAVLQKREWVGLTDEEVAEIERNALHRSQAIRAIEAKLKEKNA